MGHLSRCAELDLILISAVKRGGGGSTPGGSASSIVPIRDNPADLDTGTWLDGR